MKNKTLARVSVRVRVGVSAWIKIYIRHAENTELLPRKIRNENCPWFKSDTKNYHAS